MKKKLKPNLKPLVSIIMNCYNGEKFLKESLNSIINQTYFNWELIFWDNNSNDDSKNILKSFNDKRIFYYKSKKLLNLYHARNLALKKIKGKYISFLDVDDLWTKNKLSKQVNFLLRNEKIKVIYSNFFVLNQISKKKFLGYKRNSLPSGFITQKLMNNYKLGILTTMLEKSILKLYKFKNKYNIIGDFDFFIRVSKKFKIVCIQEPLAIYRIHNSNLTRTKVNLHIKELKEWLLNNKKLMKKLSISLVSFKISILKLKMRKYLSFLGV
jgi:glycosyltransferase involved in cell wall biosynthesis|tara:strand:- start:1051 stop:1857 length:807 start_codon:yes stop_codon:yes gene_type:complete